MFFGHRRISRAQLGASLIDCGAGREPRKQFSHAMHAAGGHRGREMVRAGHDIGDDFGLLRILDRGLKNADDGSGPIAEAAQPNCLADDRRVFLECPSPEPVSQHHSAGGLRPVVFWPDQTAKHGPQPHHIEIIATRHASLYFARLTKADHGEANY